MAGFRDASFELFYNTLLAQGVFYSCEQAWEEFCVHEAYRREAHYERECQDVEEEKRKVSKEKPEKS